MWLLLCGERRDPRNVAIGRRDTHDAVGVHSEIGRGIRFTNPANVAPKCAPPRFGCLGILAGAR